MEHGSGKCDASTIRESELQVAVIQTINLTFGDKDGMMGVLQENIETVIWQKDETSAEGINVRLEELKKKLLKLANSKKDYNSVADEIDCLQELNQKAQQRVLSRKD